MIQLSQLVQFAVGAEEDFDLNSVTPGVAGFVAIFLIVVAVIVLIFDMVRRIRRTTYRAEVKERLEAESRQDAAQPDPSEKDEPKA